MIYVAKSNQSIVVSNDQKDVENCTECKFFYPGNDLLYWGSAYILRLWQDVKDIIFSNGNNECVIDCDSIDSDILAYKLMEF